MVLAEGRETDRAVQLQWRMLWK